MAEINVAQRRTEQPEVVDRARDFWDQYSRPILIAAAVLLLLIGGYLAYKYLFQQPKEQKASEAVFKAQQYFAQDSFRLALNGDGVNPGFLKIISNYGGTKSGELARFYAGASYLQSGDAANAIKQLKEFSTDSKPVQARAYKLMGDAYAETGKNSEALEHYKKAARHFQDDDQNASEYLFMAGYFAVRVLKNNAEATTLFKELKEKFPRTQYGFEADKYLAQLGVYDTNKK
jgi:predicted negative regulator of RcsB-dependent stress response